MRDISSKSMALIACLVLSQAALCAEVLDQESLTKFFEDMYSDRITWLVPLPQNIASFKGSDTEKLLLRELQKKNLMDNTVFDGGTIESFAYPSDTFPNLHISPRLKPSVHITGLATEMLFYPEVENSPFSGDLLNGTSGYVSSENFLSGLVFNKNNPVDMGWLAHLQSTPERIVYKPLTILMLELAAGDARSHLLAGEDVLAFLYLYGHGVLNGHGETALVLPSHEMSDKSFTGLTNGSLFTAKETLQWYLQGVFAPPGKHVSARLMKPEAHEHETNKRLLEDRKRLNTNGKTRKLGIVIVLETCSNVLMGNENGEKAPISFFKEVDDYDKLLDIIEANWLAPFKEYSTIDVDIELQLLTVSEPGKSIDIDYSADNFKEPLANINRFDVGGSGTVIKRNPLNYGVLTPRIPMFLEESIYAAAMAGKPYLLSDIKRDHDYYKKHYLSENSEFNSTSDERFEIPYGEYMNRMIDRHSKKTESKNSMEIIKPDVAAAYVIFDSPSESYSNSQFKIDINWRSRTTFQGK